ncbi:MAG: antibiotic biosynthesis monooxygenase [Planctomycetaceae bacterium]
MMFADTPEPPYIAVIFTSRRSEGDAEDYGATADRMLELAQQQPGFLGVESARGSDRLGITVSYWKDEASIANWRQHMEHMEAQANGRAHWYEKYILRICCVTKQTEYQAP